MANGIISFFFLMAEKYSSVCVCVCVCVGVCVYVCFLFFFYISLNRLSGHLGCFHALAIVNSSAVNVSVHVICSNCGFLWIYAQG